ERLRPAHPRLTGRTARPRRNRRVRPARRHGGRAARPRRFRAAQEWSDHVSQPVSPAGLALDALSRHLESAGVPVAAPLRAEIVTGGRSNLTYRVTDGSSRWILRRPPLGELVPGTHDVSREYRSEERRGGQAAG